MIISLTGLISSGKDTAADYLVEHHGFRREAFAATVKDMLSVIFGWDREMIEGRTKASRDWRNTVDEWWAERLGMPDLTPRWAMQHIGTDVFRKHFDDDIWIAALERKILNSSGNVVITDARYPNELEMVKRLNGRCWSVERGDLPEWYDYAKQYNAADHAQQTTMRMLAGSTLPSHPNVFNRKIHSSEWVWIGFPFDSELDNNGSIKELYNEVENSLKSLELDLLASK